MCSFHTHTHLRYATISLEDRHKHRGTQRATFGASVSGPFLPPRPPASDRERSSLQADDDAGGGDFASFPSSPSPLFRSNYPSSQCADPSKESLVEDQLPPVRRTLLADTGGSSLLCLASPCRPSSSRKA